MNSPVFDVIVCGSLHLDIMLYAPSLPRPDETVTGSRWEQQCGGKGGNQAVQASRAGARTAMIGRVGADDFGTRLRRNLVEAGVDASAVSVDPQAGSGMSAAIVRDDGDYGAVIVSGSNLLIDPAGLGAQWRLLGGARVLVLQNEAPEAVNVEAARAARASGARVLLNAAPARTLSRELLERVDVLIFNRLEAGMLSGVEVTDRAAAFEALRRLAAPGRSAIVTLGADGLLIQPDGAEASAIAPKRVKVISSHGAGDCFVGALAARLSKGDNMRRAAEFANEEAANFVSRPRRAPGGK
jgi:ribokinase